MTLRYAVGGTVLVSTLMLAACGAKTVDIGTDAKAVTLDPSSISVAQNECGNLNFQHSNICCTGGSATTAPTCQTWPQDPFHACSEGWTTFPNAASCCLLGTAGSDNGGCATCDENAVGRAQPGRYDTEDKSHLCGLENVYDGMDLGDVPPASGGTSGPCETRCPPGYDGVSPYDAQGCCQYQADGTRACFGDRVTAMDGGTLDLTRDPNFLVVAGLPDSQLDGGVMSGSSEPICGSYCPNGVDGWFVPDDGATGVCCNGSGDDEQCFASVFPLDIQVVPQTGSSPTTRFIDGGHE